MDSSQVVKVLDGYFHVQESYLSGKLTKHVHSGLWTEGNMWICLERSSADYSKARRDVLFCELHEADLSVSFMYMLKEF